MTYSELKQAETEFKGFLKANKIKKIYSYVFHDTNLEVLKFSIKCKNSTLHIEIAITDSQFFKSICTKINEKGETVDKTYMDFKPGKESKFWMLTTLLTRLKRLN